VVSFVYGFSIGKSERESIEAGMAFHPCKGLGIFSAKAQKHGKLYRLDMSCKFDLGSKTTQQMVAIRWVKN
jgi:hypothetical protein